MQMSAKCSREKQKQIICEKEQHKKIECFNDGILYFVVVRGCGS